MSEWRSKPYYTRTPVEQWKAKVLDILWKQRLEADSPFCDVIINVQGKHLKAHWCVLMACPYFDSLYSSGMVEKNSGMVDLSISDVATVERVLEYVYTANNEIPSQSAEEILKLADYLQLELLKKHCGNILTNMNINLDNCIHLCTLADMYNIESLYKVAKNCLYISFEKVAVKSEILDVSFETLFDFIGDELLSYFSRIEFFDLIVRWVNHDIDDRSVHFEELFKALNLRLIKSDDMKRIKEEKLVSENQACGVLIKKYENEINKGEISPDDGMKEVIVFGGIRQSSKHFAYVVDESRWVRLPFMGNKHNVSCRKVYAGAVVDNELYLLKEENTWREASRLLKLNKDTGDWQRTDLESVQQAFGMDRQKSISRHSTVVGCGGYLCLIGSFGHTGDWKVEVRMFPTKAGLQYKFVRLNSLSLDTTLEEICACSIKDNMLFILGKTLEVSHTFKTIVKCVCYNLTTGAVTDCSKGAKYGEILHSEDDGKVYVHSIGSKHSNVFDYTTQKWRTARFTLPTLSKPVHKNPLLPIVHKKDVYIFGTQFIVDKSWKAYPSHESQKPHKFSYEKRVWEELDVSPIIFNSMAVPMVMKLPVSMVSCPPMCQHCTATEPFVSNDDDDSFVPTYSDEDEDDEYDDSFYGDSDSMDEPYGYQHFDGPGDCCIQ